MIIYWNGRQATKEIILKEILFLLDFGLFQSP